MFKLTVAVFLACFACQGLCKPQEFPPTGEIARLGASGNFEEASRLLRKYYEKSVQAFTTPSGLNLIPPNPLRSGLRHDGNGEYYYQQSEASYHTVVNNNGKVKEEKDGLGVVNDNGAVTYYKPASVA